MTYKEQHDLTVNVDFRNRIAIACLHFADYITAEATTTPAHNTRKKFADDTYASPDQVAMKLQPSVVMDARVQAEGAEISDADLQTAVESTVNKQM